MSVEHWWNDTDWGGDEGLGEKYMSVLLWPPQIKQDRSGFEPSISGEGCMSDCLRHGTASCKHQDFIGQSTLENVTIALSQNTGYHSLSDATLTSQKSKKKPQMYRCENVKRRTMHV